MVVEYSVKVVRLTLHRMFNMQTHESIRGKIIMRNHNIIPLMLQARWFQHMLLLRTIRGRHGMMIEHMSLMELMVILLDLHRDGSQMVQTSVSFKI